MSSEQFSATPPGRHRRCPNCGAKIGRASAKTCWLCHEELTFRQTAFESHEDKDLLGRIRLRERHSESPSMIMLGFLGILLLALGISLAIEAPGILIVLFILITPAVIRTAVAASRERAEGAPRTGLGVAAIFLASLGAVVIAGLAAYVAFWVACFLLCVGGAGRSGGDSIFYASVAVGLGVGGLILWRFWKRRG